MGFKLLDEGEFKATLSSAGRIARQGGEAALKEAAKAVKAASQARAPEKSGALVDAHFYEKTVTGNRIVYEVGVDDAEASYALRMHEGIEGGPYNLGKLSKAKNAGATPHVGVGVGWKFLERGFESKYREIIRSLELALGKVFKSK